ncbi:MAG: GMC family oxidoreductase [Streptosporangiaceae bacterium]
MISIDTGAQREGWDDVVVGAGTSGAVLASRLAEQPGRRVLLLEAGPDESQETGQGLGTPSLASHNWDYSAYLGSTASGRQYPYRMGKVVGGGSAINGAIALRGLPADFDSWAAAGNSEWAWDRVLPYFAKIEADADITGTGHGACGPVPISRPRPEEFDAVSGGFVQACRTIGLPDLPDLNGGAQVGVGPVPANRLGPRRMSSADTHLTGARRRSNLTVWGRCHVTRLLLSGQRVVGVEALRDGQPCRVAADRVALSAGAINTPVILQRSGIGDGRQLADLGIKPVIDLPGVGHNLIDHPVVAIWTVARDSVDHPDGVRHQVMARTTSPDGSPDLMLFLANNLPTARIPVIGAMLGGQPGIAVSAVLGTPASRGAVQLSDASPDADPVIVLNLAADPADVDRLMSGARQAWSLVRAAPLAGLVREPLVWTDRMMADDALLRSAVTRFVSPLWHPVGTARMAPPGDPAAVVDQSCRVYGADGLRVVDASVMPSIPAAPTNLTCVMLAEKVAEWIS